MHSNFPDSLPASRPPKLLNQVKPCIRDKHYSLRTEEADVYWIRWYIGFHTLRHPMEMGVDQIPLPK
ncbi:phage integrase N-terminal SAM-like domain-containing protein [Noviherbaspirillum sp.]|jgi:hypothetical protein|uniref:phage integrase N-terminal SAM-like domain-containing protein n=1 Tax=Noviherbaspirillum sp. TaxID=1926288 RepID=UPI003449BFAC